MNAKVFMTDGFETVEALAVVDLLRRADIETELISVTGRKEVTSAQNVVITTDRLFKNSSSDPEETADLLFLPGGPGSFTGNFPFEKIKGLKELFLRQNDEEKLIAAICAAPSVLGHWGLLRNRHAIAFPGFENELSGAMVEKPPVRVVVDGNIITGRGMGTAIDLGLAVVGRLLGDDAAQSLGLEIQYLEEE